MSIEAAIARWEDDGFERWLRELTRQDAESIADTICCRAALSKCRRKHLEPVIVAVLLEKSNPK